MRAEFFRAAFDDIAAGEADGGEAGQADGADARSAVLDTDDVVPIGKIDPQADPAGLGV